MFTKRAIIPLLLLIALLSACQDRSTVLFRENFADAPGRAADGPDAVPPALDEDHLPAIIAVCEESRIAAPRFPTDSNPPNDGALLQRSAYHRLENGRDLRCTYFLYVGETEVYSRWIEASESGSNLISIFPADTPEERLLKEFQ